MDSLYLPILCAGAVAFFVWALGRAITASLNNDKKKLSQRLGNEGQKQTQATASQIVRAQMEASGATGLLTQFSPLQGLQRKIIQAYPDGSLIKFLSIVAIVAVFMFIIVTGLMGSALVGLAAGGFGGYIPFMVLSSKK